MRFLVRSTPVLSKKTYWFFADGGEIVRLDMIFWVRADVYLFYRYMGDRRSATWHYSNLQMLLVFCGK